MCVYCLPNGSIFFLEFLPLLLRGLTFKNLARALVEDSYVPRVEVLGELLGGAWVVAPVLGLSLVEGSFMAVFVVFLIVFGPVQNAGT